MRIFKYFLLVLGAFIAAMGYVLFILPASLAPGGVSGIAALINFITGFPVGISILLINIPLFLLSRKHLGMEFGIKSLIGTIALSVFIDAVPIKSPVENDPLVCAVFGGVLTGLGLALAFSSGGSTGGVDILGKLVHARRPEMSLGSIMLATDAVIVLCSMLVSGIMTGLYSLIAVFFSTKTIDYILNGFSSAKAYCIISRENDKIAHRIMQELERGVTVLEGHGAYTGNKNNMLICLIQRQDISRLKQIVKAEDTGSFGFVLPASEVMGNGFSIKN